jgi:hypothetical protein
MLSALNKKSQDGEKHQGFNPGAATSSPWEQAKENFSKFTFRKRK